MCEKKSLKTYYMFVSITDVLSEGIFISMDKD